MLRYKSSNLVFCIIFLTTLTLVVSFISPISVFSMHDADGFYVQVMDIKENINEVHQLTIIHTIRYIIISPFLWLESIEFGNAINTFIICFFLVFLIFKHWKYLGKVSFFVSLLLVVPYFVSMRTSLLIISMFILYLFIIGAIKARLLFILGFILSILSSGAVLNYFIALFYMIFISKRVSVNKFFLFPVLCGVLISILPSLMNKIKFFGGGVDGLYNMVARSNVFAAAIYGHYIKLAVYVFLTVVILCSYRFFNRDERFMVILCLLSLFFLEGLGSLALIPVVLYFSLYRIKIFKL